MISYGDAAGIRINYRYFREIDDLCSCTTGTAAYGKTGIAGYEEVYCVEKNGDRNERGWYKETTLCLQLQTLYK